MTNLEHISLPVARNGVIFSAIAIAVCVLDFFISAHLWPLTYALLIPAWVCIGINFRRHHKIKKAERKIKKAERETRKIEENERAIARLERELGIGDDL